MPGSLLAAVFACLLLPTTQGESTEPSWALAIHGGAGTIPRDMEPGVVTGYRESLRAALALGARLLEKGGTSLDAVEAVVVALEDDPRFNAGKGAVFTHTGTHELDACVMDGRSLEAGAIAGVQGVKNPIRLARLVMERSRHVMLVGRGAEEFGREMEVEFVEPDYFFTERRHAQWQKALESDSYGLTQEKKGTVGCVALDVHGNLAAATSTGGLTNKRYGRVGDVPILGAGTYASNRTCAISCTGYGERFIRFTVAHDVSALMEYGSLSLEAAARKVIHDKLQPGDGGLVAVSHTGEIALVYSSEGMFRGAADSRGRFDVAIWEAKDAGKDAQRTP